MQPRRQRLQGNEYGWPYLPRVGQPDDENMVYANWIDSLRGNPPFREMRHGEFQREQRKIVTSVLNRPNVQVFVACHPSGEPRYGWLCCERGSDGTYYLHYIYVQKLYRQKHLATSLLMFSGCDVGKVPIVATSWTKALGYHASRWQLNFNPFVIWGCHGVSG